LKKYFSSGNLLAIFEKLFFRRKHLAPHKSAICKDSAVKKFSKKYFSAGNFLAIFEKIFYKSKLFDTF